MKRSALPDIPHNMRGEIIQRIAFLEKSRPLLIDYCRQKLEAEDFHGVADAAMDLRDLDSELSGLKY